MSTQQWWTRGPAGALAKKTNRDARRRKRLKISLPVNLRPFDARFRDLEEVGQVIDFTRDGMYCRASMTHYFVGMRLQVIFPYGDKFAVRKRFLGVIVRIEHSGNRKGASLSSSSSKVRPTAEVLWSRQIGHSPV